MPHEKPKTPRHTKASALHEEWTAEREARRLRLISLVESSFRDVRLGSGVSLHQARAMDDYRDDATIAAARALDPEERWQETSGEKLVRLSDTLPFMDAQGFRLHLPRFMLFALRNEDPGSWAGGAAISSCDLRGISAERLAILSAEQRQAIQAFSEFYADEV